MNLPYRLESALTKLYLAFHEGRLDPENCCHCAVGNICDNFDAWKHFTDRHGSVKLNYLGKLNESYGKRINGYSPKELLTIEAIFLKGCGYTLSPDKKLLKPSPKIDQETMFSGLTTVIKYLCELDGVNNVMELYRSFDFNVDQKSHSTDM